MATKAERNVNPKLSAGVLQRTLGWRPARFRHMDEGEEKDDNYVNNC